MTEPLDPTLQTVIVTASKTPPSDDVTLIINGQAYGGWLDVRITRGVERLPSDFELRLTDLYVAEADQLQIKAGDPCVVKIGKDPVITGYVDVVQIGVTRDQHTIAVFGRSKCADLVDCSAEWPGGQIVGSSVLEIAKKLAAPYGITVDAIDDQGGPIPQFNLMRGESPYDILERLCRFRQLLLYDDADGNLLLARVSTRSAASGFRQGINVESATVDLSAHERFSEYRCYPQAVAQFLDVGDGGDLIALRLDQGVLRHRVKIIVAESSGGGIGGAVVAADRAGWEASRRYGRSFVARVTTDSWRDKSGALYEANTLIALDLPTLKVSNKRWAISSVTYRKGADGTHCDLVMMPKQAFDIAPTVFDTALAAEVANLPAGSK